MWMGSELIGSVAREPPKVDGLEKGRIPAAWFSPQATAKATGKDEGKIRETWLLAIAS